MSQNIYATCINIKSKGVLLLGDSGSGKSDLALRLITLFSAKLISDDRTEISKKRTKIIASTPKTIKGLLEVRGVGIVKFKHQKETKVDLIIKLTDEKIERIPQKEEYDLEGIKIPMFYLNPFEVSAPSKVLAMLSLLWGFENRGWFIMLNILI